MALKAVIIPHVQPWGISQQKPVSHQEPKVLWGALLQAHSQGRLVVLLFMTKSADVLHRWLQAHYHGY